MIDPFLKDTMTLRHYDTKIKNKGIKHKKLKLKRFKNILHGDVIKLLL